MSSFTPSEKGTTIRQPSTANLMLDSADRDATKYKTAWDFQITKPQALLNGFFTRIGTTEVVLEWNFPNGPYLNSFPAISVSYGPTPVVQNVSITDPLAINRFYTVADLLEQFVANLNTAFGLTSGSLFEVVTVANVGVVIQTEDNADWSMTPNATTEFLCFEDTDITLAAPSHYVGNPDLRPYRYLDFVSAQLTYNQDLKDAATNTFNRDVLCRWYMDWDNPPALDALGFPILMGYTPFYTRRLYNPPKQIRWDNIQPLGNLSFQVYGSDGRILPAVDPTEVPLAKESNWLMTLQISEV